jgi:hypothetical protein
VNDNKESSFSICVTEENVVERENLILSPKIMSDSERIKYVKIIIYIYRIIHLRKQIISIIR